MHLLVGKPDYHITVIVQPFCAGGVVLNLCQVGIAVHFYYQVAGRTAEVNNEAINRMLSSELVAAQLPISKPHPQRCLSRRLWVA